MTLYQSKTLFLSLAITSVISSFAQSDTASALKTPEPQATSPSETLPAQQVLVVTGARFSYKLVEKWIEGYHQVNPHVQIIVDSRGSTDPLKYDILAEVYEHDEETRKNRQYIYVGRYAVLPVANSASSFATAYTEKGLNADLIRQIFFHDVFSGKSKQNDIATPYTVYTRLQRAGVPMVFSQYYGYEQKDLKGTSIAGADVHLIKAVQRDSTGVTYLPLPLIYDEHSRKPLDGLAVLPVDLNGNKKVSGEEKFYDTIDRVARTLEESDPGKIKNIPIEYLHLSVDKNTASREAINFLKWVNEYGQDYLHEFGFLKPEAGRSDKESFDEFASVIRK